MGKHFWDLPISQQVEITVTSSRMDCKFNNVFANSQLRGSFYKKIEQPSLHERAWITHSMSMLTKMTHRFGVDAADEAIETLSSLGDELSQSFYPECSSSNRKMVL